MTDVNLVLMDKGMRMAIPSGIIAVRLARAIAAGVGLNVLDYNWKIGVLPEPEDNILPADFLMDTLPPDTWITLVISGEPEIWN